MPEVCGWVHAWVTACCSAGRMRGWLNYTEVWFQSSGRGRGFWGRGWLRDMKVWSKCWSGMESTVRVYNMLQGMGQDGQLVQEPTSQLVRTSLSRWFSPLLLLLLRRRRIYLLVLYMYTISIFYIIIVIIIIIKCTIYFVHIIIITTIILID